MDVLSETLKIIRLSGAIFFTAQVSGRWAVSSPPSDELSGLMNAKSDCIVLFHVVTSGQCMVRIKNKEPFILEEGSMILLPHSISHTIGNNMKIKPDPVGDFVNFNQKEIPNINYSRDGEGDVKLICGYLKCNQYFNPLIK